VNRAILRELREEVVPPRHGRVVGRGVKRKMSNYPLRPLPRQPTTLGALAVRIV